MCDSGCQELRVEKNGERPCSRYRAHFRSNKNGLELGRGSDYPTLKVYLATAVYFKMVPVT